MADEKSIKEQLREIACNAADRAERVNDAGTGIGEKIAKELREIAECKELKEKKDD